MAAMTSTVMVTATMTMGEGDEDNGKDDHDGKDDEGGGGSIPDCHTTINYMRIGGGNGDGDVDGNSDENNNGKDEDKDNGEDDGVDGEDDNAMAITKTMARMTMAVAVAFLPDMQCCRPTALPTLWGLGHLSTKRRSNLSF
jgi:hypothetical protein